MSSEYAVIGKDNNVFIYKVGDQHLTQTQVISNPFADFGASLNIQNQWLSIRSPSENSGTGVVYLYKLEKVRLEKDHKK